jgi:hypothetical protein
LQQPGLTINYATRQARARVLKIPQRRGSKQPEPNLKRERLKEQRQQIFAIVKDLFIKLNCHQLLLIVINSSCLPFIYTCN